MNKTNWRLIIPLRGNNKSVKTHKGFGVVNGRREEAEEPALQTENAARCFAGTGYHGTNSSRVASILKSGFNVSSKSNEWLGSGVYFFVKGINCPIKLAEEWAIAQAYDKATRRNTYMNASVLEAEISCSAMFDATTEENRRFFHQMVDELVEKERKLPGDKRSYFKKDRQLSDDPAVIWDWMSRLLGLDGIKSDVEIKCSARRVFQIKTNVPNATILCVRTPDRIQSVKTHKTVRIRP